VIGVLTGVGIFFEPNEPYKKEIFAASTIRNMLVALLTGFSLNAQSTWYSGAGMGMAYGFAFGLVIFLAKGAFKSKDAPFVMAASMVSGILIGLIVVTYAF